MFVECNLNDAELSGANLAGSSLYRSSLRRIHANNSTCAKPNSPRQTCRTRTHSAPTYATR
ncbi:pentapeptide repeat-containing protein [Streptomyces violascens]|uniref:pentapeptide repeat-containing protein n=1 Tax=Streptomyces violascens TaxID=67381 RepID=UPI00167C0A72